MSQIKVNNLSFSYEGSYEKVFDNINLILDTDWKLGLIGRNGKGKTTFLKLLLGEYKYNGSITKSVNLDYFPFNIENENLDTLDIINNIIPNVEDWEIFKELNLINTNIEILYRPFNTLSGGEKVKALLVTLFLKDNEFLLIDEPTNHLDEKSKKDVENYLKNKKGFILVSHDRTLLNNVVDHILSINNKDIEIVKGNYDSWRENRDNINSFEIMKNEKLNKDINRLKMAAQQTNNWSNDVEKTKTGNKVSGLRPDRGYIGHQSAKMMKRSKVIEGRIEKEIEEKESLLLNIDKTFELIMKPEICKKKELIIAKDLQIKYDNKEIFNKVSFCIENTDRVSLTGENGSGKSSIIKLILGESISYNGYFSVKNDLKISYVAQDTKEVSGTIKDYANKFKVDESIFRAMLQKLGVESKYFNRDLTELSEGQKKKVMIARSISESAELYIWDEMLNYIDIQSREQIESMILKYKPTILFVEHDETFRNKIMTKEIVLEKI